MAAIKELSFNLGLGANSTSNVEDPEAASELLKIYNAVNTLASKLDEYSGTLTVTPADRPYVPTSQTSRAKYVNRLYLPAPLALTARTVVNIYASGVRAAVVGTYAAHAIVLEDTAAGDYAPITLQGVIGGFVGLTVGAPYYLSASAGAIQSGVTAQKVGFAISSTELAFGYLI